MFRKIMSEIDVKLGLKTILERVESAYGQRPKVTIFGFNYFYLF